MSKPLCFLLILSQMLSCFNSINWQGTGNMSLDNTTEIQTYINKNFKPQWTRNDVISNPYLLDFSTGLSDHLNEIWDPAWNVFTVLIDVPDTNTDSVVYGYAFRDHWMWFNGMKLANNYYLSLIIWKDYNCITWYTFNGNNGVSPPYSYKDPTSIFNAKTPIYTTSSKEKGIWAIAQSYSKAMQATIPNTAFTVIACETKLISVFFAKFCAKDYMILGALGRVGQGPQWGYGMLIQTR